MTDSNTNNSFGILSFGAYVPTLRMQRKAIAAAVGWAVPGIKGLGKGERSVGNWDEDTITMAVEAGRDTLANIAMPVDRVELASTTLPFADRSNSGVVADALRLDRRVATEDLGGSRRAATSALIRAGRADGDSATTLLIASDCRDTRPGSTQEMSYGHGAAALLIGRGEPIAVIKAAASIHEDLIDQYRSADAEYDYSLEQRWVRDEGYLKIVPDAIRDALEQCDSSAGEVHRFVLPASSGIIRSLAKKLGVDAGLFIDPLDANCGDCGAAHPLLLLTGALESAVPGERILVAGFGQGADVVILETTPKLAELQDGRGPGRQLAQGRETDNYTFFLAIRNRISIDFGLRSERDNRTAMSVYYRKRHDITGLMGGRCSACNTLQFPRSLVCVKCGATESQQPESLADRVGHIKTYTEDWLAYTPCPPYIYGNVEFADGANIMMEFADFEPGQAAVGMPVRMVFRVKDFDTKRDFRRYFWKPTPLLDDGQEEA